MRAMWRKYGKPGGGREGYVDHPYTIADAEATLAEVSGDRAFARDFFARYIQGHDVADYGRLLAHAGFTVRKRNAGHAWLGDLRLEVRSGVHVAKLVAPTWPIYAAGIDQDDELRTLDAQRIASDGDVQRCCSVTSRATASASDSSIARASRKRPRSRWPRIRTSKWSAVDSLTAAQHSFRERWLGAR